MYTFEDMLGQEQLKAHMRNALARDKVGHAYIISGEKGSGKDFASLIFAAGINCSGEGGRPCGKCRSCRQTFDGNHPDVRYLIPEKENSTNISVDMIRHQVNEDVVIKPYEGRKKIYIIRNAENMNERAQNALLKTIEEPPEYVVILLVTANPENLIDTIHSRCTGLKTGQVDRERLKRFLQLKAGIPDYMAEVCAAFSKGNVGLALHLAGSDGFEGLRARMLELTKNIKDMSILDIRQEAAGLKECKAEINDFLDLLLVWYRDVLVVKSCGFSVPITFEDQKSLIKRMAEDSSYEGLKKITDAIEEAKGRLFANVNYELTLELLLMTLKEN